MFLIKLDKMDTFHDSLWLIQTSTKETFIIYSAFTLLESIGPQQVDLNMHDHQRDV